MSKVKVFNELLGMEVEIPETPTRVVSLAPSVTDTLYWINAWNKVVGVSYFCFKPPEARHKPKVGSYFNVNYNLLNELSPDLIIVTTGAQRRLGIELAKKGYSVYAVGLPVSLYGIIENVNIIGLLVDRVSEARKTATLLIDKLQEIRARYSGRRLRVYYEVDLGEPITIGSATYIDHALESIGLENIFRGIRRGYIKPDFDRVLQEDPDLIVYEPKPFTKPDPDRVIRMLESRRMWFRLRAIRRRHVLVLEPDSLAHYGPTLFNTLEKIGRRVEEFEK
ncbi:MAG: ABC transporter substrate-binding protein [Pyrodictiaceae archaeon]